MKKLLILILVLSFLPVFSLANEIYSYSEIIPIAKGITLTKVESFYSDHNLSYSYITVDLENENIGLSLLKSQKGQDYKDTALNLSKTEENVVASLNGDFFSTDKGGKTISLGIEVKDGKLLQSPIYPDTMATFSSADKEIFLDYLSFTVAVVAPNWEFETIRHINKHTEYFGEILMYEGNFNGGYSLAPGGNVVEVVVEDGILTEFRRNMPPCPIPENGYILSVSEGDSMFFANNFSVGDEVKIDYYITPDIREADLAFGGGAILVKDGKALETFSHSVTGYNPRSAIGLSEDGKTLYLAAVNGRQEESRGMTMSELARLMADLGSYTAMNLDGGGSTYMAASTPWLSEIHKVNSPAENRSVVNAIGVTFSADYKPKAKGIILENEKNAVFIGEGVKISSAIYDQNLRPFEGTLSWSADKGTVENGVFTATDGGMAKIKARSGKATAETEIFVVDKISGIDAADSLKLKLGESKSLTFNVFDREGHFVSVNNITPFELTSSNPDIVSVKDGVITSHKNGSAVISIKKDNAASFISVISGQSEAPYLDEFSEANGSFSSYPAYVGGDYTLTEDGLGALSFDFTQDTEDSKAAYFTLENPLTLADNSKEIKIDVKTEGFFTHEIKALLTDGNGNDFRISFGRDLEEGTHTLSGVISADTPRPVILKRIYAIAVTEEEKDEGTIYLDNLSLSIASPIEYPHKEENIYDDKTPSQNEGEKVKIGVLSTSDTLISRIANGKINEELKDSDYSYIVGDTSSFKTEQSEKALFITLNSKGGIRKADKNAWDKMQKAIDESSLPYVFILSDSSLFGSDSFENKVIEDYLSSVDKAVSVITKGEANTLTIKGNVRYFTLSEVSGNAPFPTRINNLSYLEFTLGDSLSYEKKTVIE